MNFSYIFKLWLGTRAVQYAMQSNAHLNSQDVSASVIAVPSSSHFAFRYDNS